MISRRQLMTSLAALPMMLVVPAAEGASASLAPEPSAALELTDEIRQIESTIASSPNQFSWWAHNELRHLYLPISERVSRYHADIVLANMPMDDYILNTLSDWHLTHNEGQYSPERAIATLLDQVERYPEFVHVGAACLIKVGDVYRMQGLNAQADKLYRHVTSVDSALPTLKVYRSLALNRLIAA